MDLLKIENKKQYSSYLTEKHTVAILGMGYVGLPIALALHSRGMHIIGIDLSNERLEEIKNGTAELIEEDAQRLNSALLLDPERFLLTQDSSSLTKADTIIIAVPTPINADLSPDLRPIKAASATVVKYAQKGQTIILTSTTYVGCTRDLIATPLSNKGYVPGVDIHVAFSPERIDPGNTKYPQSKTPKILGGISEASTEAAWKVLRFSAPRIHIVSSIEAAEMTKLVENTFRAVNIAWINEMADIAGTLGLDISEVIDAAGTKPYGFTKFSPGAGVGGHCIPCDPHYLLSKLPTGSAPITELSMQAIHNRPSLVASRTVELLLANKKEIDSSTVVLVGVAYKPNVRDTRESPALDIISHLTALGITVKFVDPLVKKISINGRVMTSSSIADISDDDLIIWLTPHDILDPKRILKPSNNVLDTTYKLPKDIAKISVI